MKDILFIKKHGRHPNKNELDYIINNTNITLKTWILLTVVLCMLDLILLLVLILKFRVLLLGITILANILGIITILNKYFKTPNLKDLTKENIYLLDVNYYEDTIRASNNVDLHSYQVKVLDTDFHREINYIYGSPINGINQVYEVTSRFNKPKNVSEPNIRYIKYDGTEKDMEIENLKNYKNQADGVEILYFAVIKKNHLLTENGINKKNI